MSCVHYKQDDLYLDGVSLNAIADQFGTPCYVYSRNAIEAAWTGFHHAFSNTAHRICYAVKANSNLAILQLLANLGSGFDIVSIGEMDRVLAAGGKASSIVFSGVGKRSDEIERAIQAGIFCFNIESEAELERLNAIANKLQTRVNIGLRVNPDIDPQTHSHISTGMRHNKFGIDMNIVLPLCQFITTLPYVNLIGIAGHIGSQILDLTPLLQSIDKLIGLYQQISLAGIHLNYINVGGGLGITYKDETPPGIAKYAAAIKERFSGYPVEIIFEPGRYIVGNAGVLLTRVEYLKQTDHKNFAIVDAGMNDLIRPALYHAWQNILPVKKHDIAAHCYDIAGPVCESADFIGKDRHLAIKQGDLLAVNSAGAYGFSMSSNYNTRCRAAEVLIEDDKARLIRRRESIDDLLAAENTQTYIAKPA